jgi:two-component system sensor histidine kinase QseC
MAHELKTPMTLLRMSIDELMSQTKASPASLQNVENELRKLEHIIMDFLEWASVENDSFRPDLHAINVPQRTQELVHYLEKTFAQMEITVTNKASDDFRIFCNPIHFDQMLNNLVSNAAKYGNGKLNIICENGKLTVIDNGEGLPENVLKNFGKPFNKFSQNGISGHGLGLAWVNTIANKYNWKINVDVSSGTRFEIMFPLN